MTRQPPRRHSDQYSETETIKRRDDAIRRALNTPPKPYKDSKIGKSTASAAPPKRKK